MKYDIVIHSYEGRLQNVFKIRSKLEVQMVHEINYYLNVSQNRLL